MTRSRSVAAVLGRAGPAVVAAAALAAEAPALARDRAGEAAAIEDLAYGEVLFHFYQQDYLTALTRLLAAQSRDELPSHAADAELLLGGLYLSYGQHRLAGGIFEQLLAQHDDAEIHDRAWFFLAKIWRQRGYVAEAEAALARIAENLPEELEGERRLLEAQVLMDQGRFDEAHSLLQAWTEPGDEWVGYAQYNVGVALVRLGRVTEGAAMLERVAQLEAGKAADPERAALRDKANVALGYAWLQAGEPALAKPPLQRVRLSGPFSNKALLGVGWSETELANHRAALAPWLELKDRSLLDAAVQESLLAVPYAFAQLGADGQAADHYLDAIAAFDEEIARIDASSDALRAGRLIDDLLAQPAEFSSGWYWELDRVPDSVESRYLYELLSTHRFQEALKNYRDLLLLIRTLDGWTESIDAFDDILDTRQRAYEQRRPVIDRSLDGLDLDQMTTQRVRLESRLTAIERTRDVVALGTPEEQRLWSDLTGLETDLALLGDDAAASPLRAKQRFLKGLLMWDLERDYKARLWTQKSSLRRLDLDLKEAQARRHSVAAAREAWPDQFAALTTRIDGLAPRLQSVQQAAHAALARQQQFLESLAIEELDAQRERLTTYRVQARFSLAAIYDRAAVRASQAQTQTLTSGVDRP